MLVMEHHIFGAQGNLISIIVLACMLTDSDTSI
jgi:hypothetical protein